MTSAVISVAAVAGGDWMSVTPRQYFTTPTTATRRGLVAGDGTVWRRLTNQSSPVETDSDGQPARQHVDLTDRGYGTLIIPLSHGRQPGFKSGHEWRTEFNAYTHIYLPVVGCRKS